MSDYGRLLKSARESSHTSQSKLAERAGFDHSYVSRLESGARVPTRDAVDRLNDALGLPEVTRQELIAAAGFLPADPMFLLEKEPEIGAALQLLADETVPAPYRDNLRSVLRLLCEQVRFATRTGAVA